MSSPSHSLRQGMSDGPARLLVTLGDPAGIGPEIILKAYAERGRLSDCVFAVYGDVGTLRRRAKRLGLAITVEAISHPNQSKDAFKDALPVIQAAPDEVYVGVTAGKPTQISAVGTISAIAQSVAALHAGQAEGVVTAPINKAVLYDHGFQHPGHTEYLAALADKHWPQPQAHRSVMMLASDALRVVPVTIHIPVKNVPQALTTPLIIETCRIVADSLTNDFAIAAPRLAITGLNPHAGENGSMGTEEETVIAPAIATLRAMGINVRGPLPADTIFHERARQNYDVAICMYHDQANIPIKTLAFDDGVNCTLGLPFIRTSPDHGTAFDIADQGIARPDSFMAALRQAGRMALARRQSGAKTLAEMAKA